MRRIAWLALVLLAACGKEASFVPIVQLAPSPSAVATFAPATLPPTVAPTIAPTPTLAPATPTPAPTPKPATPTPKPTAPPGVHPITNHPNTPTNAPPDGYLRAASGEIKGDITHYNWQTEPQHHSVYDDNTPDPVNAIPVKRGAVLKIAFTRSDTETNSGARFRTSAAANAKPTAIFIDKKNPATITANFPPGTIWLDVFTYWPQGDVEHTFKLKVS